MKVGTEQLAILRTRGHLRYVASGGVVSASHATGGFALHELVSGFLADPRRPTQPRALVERRHSGFGVIRDATGRELSGLFRDRTGEQGWVIVLQRYERGEAGIAPTGGDIGVLQVGATVGMLSTREELELPPLGGVLRMLDPSTETNVVWTQDEEATNDLEAYAAQVARNLPSVESARPSVPELTGNLITDVRRLCDLTANDLATIFGRTERAIQGWRRNGPPEEFERPLRALEAVGLTLVGGLGPSGVRRWLTSGDPSPLARIAAGDIESVSEDLRQYEDFVAT
jgi:hypothetical protein